MKNRLAFLVTVVIGLSIYSCSYDRDPDFVTMQNIKFTTLNKEQIVMKANALYYNPNDVGCDLVKTDVDVYIDEVLVGHVDQIGDTDITPKANFKIPMTIAFPTRKIFKDKKSLIEGIAGIFAKKEVKVRYKGSVTLDVMGVEYESEFDYSEKLPLRQRR